MSNHLISLAYTRQVGSLARKAVLVFLADKASDDGTGIWASKRTIAEELCTSKQTVIAVIKSFISDGILVETGTKKCRTGATIEYAICRSVVEALPLVKGSSKLTGQTALPVKQVDAKEVKLLDPNPPSEPITPVSANADTPPIPDLELVSEEAPPFVLKVEHVFEAWNDMAARTGLPKAKTIDDERRRKARALIRRRSIDDITEAINAVERSPFCRGENNRAWRADVDFLFQSKSFNRLIEGSYDGK